ncbi:MAG: succinate dehydrogenase iron-sulfur subunit [Planctomycetota bacterium]|nr:MAG: succinate dehydrogenase iron-sulfur subunit [Planctomycetota bacterium]
MSQSHNGHPGAKRTFEVRVLRQDDPDSPSYWERHRLEHKPDMNVTSVLQAIAAQGETIDGVKVAPVAYDANCLEEVCGSCTMIINGRVRQACSALVDKLLAEKPDEIELQPMSKFPVLRDLCVNRRRLFRALEKVQAWIPVDGYYDMGPGPRQSQDQQERAYPLSQCMSCGCCLDACPQYGHVPLVARGKGESDASHEARENATYDVHFVGAHAISQAVYYNSHPTGAMNAGERIDALTEPGGIQVCGNAQNCVAVCPKEIPLTTSIGRAGRAATKRVFTKFFDR